MTIKFNILDWHSYDNDEKEYVIDVFGRTKNNKTIYVSVTDYTPYFYVKVPSDWSNIFLKLFVESLTDKNQKIYKADIVKKKDLIGFTDGRLFNFIRLIFKNHKDMRNCAYCLSRRLSVGGLPPKKYKLYESNIDPILRFIHIQNLEVCGWAKIKHYENIDNVSICDINVKVFWKNMVRYENNMIASFSVASFDIECTSGDGTFPQARRESDKIIQIGTTFQIYGETERCLKHLITLDTCDEIKDVQVESYETEEQVLLAWARLIERENPDIITGYNIHGFDEKYLHDRSVFYGCSESFEFLSRIIDEKTEFVEKELSSNALGQNKLYYYNMIGRIKIDLYKVIQRDYKLTSYKLDNVAAHFIKEKILDVQMGKKKKRRMEIKTNSAKDLQKGSYISIVIDDGMAPSKLNDGQKFKVKKIKTDIIIVEGDEEDCHNIWQYLDDKRYKVYWCQAKDDIKPKDIFRLQQGTAKDRAKIGKYCIKDCELVNILISKLDVITNNIAMANVCHVPLSYIFLRGQGIKIFSLVAKKCRQEGYLIPVIKSIKREEEDKKIPSYYGAYVFPPKAGVYFSPITVLDYASLYPRSMIERNLSHETILFNNENCCKPTKDTHFHQTYYENTKCPDGYKHCKKIHCINKKCSIKHEYKEDDSSRTHCLTHCTFAQKKDEKGNMIRGIIPDVLHNLLEERSITKKQMKAATDPFKKKLLDGKQLALKVTANSIYGQTGSDFSKIRMKAIAASTTAIGKELLNLAQQYVEEKFEGAEVIYGDTDSIFVKFNIVDKNGNPDTSKRALEKAIEFGKIASEYANSKLPHPHNLEYEKVFFPFCILNKKRYVGNLYEHDPNKFYQKNMGIVLKRRDNADIVKLVVGGIIDKIINEKDVAKAVHFTKQALKNIINGNYPISKFIITKTLKGNYKKPEQNAHKVLADRMAERDPGNKPQVNDRIPFVYKVIDEKGRKNILQGERAENPQYLIDNNLEIDYLFYIKKQIMKPSLQFLELLISEPEKIFLEEIYKEENRRKGMKEITHFFKKSKKDCIGDIVIL